MAQHHKKRKIFTRQTWAIFVAVLVVVLIGYMALRLMCPALPGKGAGGDITVSYNAETETVLLQLPYTLEGLPIAGSVTLRHPLDNGLDLKFRLKPDRNMRQRVNVTGLEKGRWRVRLFFTAGEESYYSEKSIQIE